MNQETVELNGNIEAMTEQAILFDDSDDKVWIPRSQILNWDSNWDLYDEIFMEIPEWLAIDKGLV